MRSCFWKQDIQRLQKGEKQDKGIGTLPLPLKEEGYPALIVTMGVSVFNKQEWYEENCKAYAEVFVRFCREHGIPMHMNMCLVNDEGCATYQSYTTLPSGDSFFDYSDIWEESGAQLLEEFRMRMSTYDVPFHCSVCISNSAEDSKYINEGVMCGSRNIRLTNDLITRHLCVDAGFDVVPARSNIKIRTQIPDLESLGLV